MELFCQPSELTQKTGEWGTGASRVSQILLILLIMCLKKPSRRFCFGHIIYRIYRIGGLSRAETLSRRGFCFSWRKFPPDLLYFTTMLRSVPKCSFAANGICRSASSSSSAFWYTKSRNMKHGRLASEVPKGFFRAVFGVPRMRASVCSVVTLQYAFPLNPLKNQVFGAS